jgi:hypothetical protein
VGDVAEDTASADRGELLIITDQSDTDTSIDGDLHGRVEGEGVGQCQGDSTAVAVIGFLITRCLALRVSAASEGVGVHGLCRHLV